MIRVRNRIVPEFEFETEIRFQLKWLRLKYVSIYYKFKTVRYLL